MKLSFVALGLVAFASLAAVGCAAPSNEDPAPLGGDEDDLTARSVPGAVAVEIAEVRNQDKVLSSKTLGAPKKVKSVLAGVRKLRRDEPVPKCIMQDTTRLTFLGADGKAIATVSSYCAGFGSIDFASGKEGYGVKFDGEAVAAAKDAPFAVGDALWGSTTIELAKPGTQEKRTITGDAMKPILEGFDLDEVPNPNAAFPRCLPSHSVTFLRGKDKVAYSSFLCGVDAAPASLQAAFTAPDPAKADATLAHGGITLKPKAILKAFETKQ